MQVSKAALTSLLSAVLVVEVGFGHAFRSGRRGAPPRGLDLQGDVRGPDEGSVRAAALREEVPRRVHLVEGVRNLSGITLDSFSVEALQRLDLSGVRYSAETTWPSGFDPDVAGAVQTP